MGISLSKILGSTLRVFFALTDSGPPEIIMPLGLALRMFSIRSIARKNFGINPKFSDTPSNQLSILRTKIQNNYFF